MTTLNAKKYLGFYNSLFCMYVSTVKFITYIYIINCFSVPLREQIQNKTV